MERGSTDSELGSSSRDAPVSTDLFFMKVSIIEEAGGEAGRRLTEEL